MRPHPLRLFTDPDRILSVLFFNPEWAITKDDILETDEETKETRPVTFGYYIEHGSTNFEPVMADPGVANILIDAGHVAYVEERPHAFEIDTVSHVYQITDAGRADYQDRLETSQPPLKLCTGYTGDGRYPRWFRDQVDPLLCAMKEDGKSVRQISDETDLYNRSYIYRVLHAFDSSLLRQYQKAPRDENLG